MPMYDYACPKCGTVKEYLLDFDHEPPTCLACGQDCGKDHVEMRMVFTAPAIYTTSFNEGYDMGAGRYFSTERQRDAWLKDNNLRRIIS